MAPVEGQSNTSLFDGWDKWQIAVVVGAPICLGLAGLWYYNRSHKTSETDQDDKQQAEKTSPASEKSPDSLSTGLGSTSSEPTKEAKAEDEGLTKAQSLKNEGNKLFKQGKYADAIRCYTEALEVCPPEHTNEVSTFYANRAAAYEKLKNPQKVIENCTEAINLNGKYTKALSRRANAAEQLGDLTMSLEDVTAVCILEGFQNQGTLQMADRVLKNLGKEKAKEALQNKKAGLPSKHYVKSYLAAFTQDPVQQCFINQKSMDESGDKIDNVLNNENTDVQNQSDLTNGETKCTFKDAVEKLRNQHYEEVAPLCCLEVDREPPSEYRQLALLLRGTIYSLSGQHEDAFADFGTLLGLPDLDKKIKTNALIKRAALYITKEKQSEGLEDFAEAEKTDPDNSDIFHHRGHQQIEMEKLDNAIQDFEKSIAMNPEFPQSYIQKSYAEHRRAAAEQSTAKLERAIKSYEETLKKFPNNADGHALYAQALCDLGRFDDADNEFVTAIRLEPGNANTLVHRALLKLQWKQTIDEPVDLIKKAIDLDEKCEYAYEILGTIEVQRGDMVNAVKLFEKAIDLCRKETELSHLFSLLNAAKAQLKAAQTLGIQLPSHFSPL